MTGQTVNGNRGRGKRFEKQVAKSMGGERIGIFGGTDIHVRDGQGNSKFSIEAKTRMKFSGQVFMDQAIRNALPDSIPIVIVHINGKYHKNDLVILRMQDWQMLVPNEIFEEVVEE